MLRNYLSVAVRALARHKLYSAINIVGLAVGLASCIVIFLFVRDQLSYDKWLPGHERIYRIDASYAVPGRDVIRSSGTPVPALPALREHFADIETGTRFMVTYPTIERGDRVVNEQVLYAEPSFFDVFDLPLVHGDRGTALADESSLVVSEAMAEKWFGRADPLGQVLTLARGGKKKDMRVTGVLRNLPHNTHLRVDFLARLDWSSFQGQSPFMLWGNAPVVTYIKLRPSGRISALVAGFPAFAKRYLPDVTAGDTTFELAKILRFSPINVCDIQLRSTTGSMMKRTGDARMVYTIAAIALMILFIACINYMNLTTARAGQREREIAIRKVVGASRRQLIVQFLGESVLVAITALLLALALVEVSLPALNSFLSTRLAVHYLGVESILPQAAALVLIVGLFGGLYPAFYLSRFRPAATLKANRSRGGDGSARVRTALVPIQFAIMIALLVCTAVVYAQTAYSQSLEMGFDRERILLVRELDRSSVGRRSETLAKEVGRLSHVVGVARASHLPGDDSGFNLLVERPGQQSAGKASLLERTAVDGNFFELLGIPLLAGRTLSESIARDDATLGDDAQIARLAGRGINILVDDLARARLGFASPAAAVGQPVRVMVPEPLDATIVGVTAGYRFRSTRDGDLPTVFFHDRSGFNTLAVRYEGRGPTVMAEVADVWRRLLPDVPFRADYIESAIAAQYQEEETRGRIFAIFAALAVVIACLGLLGMASFAAERRVVEIGIRKALGASAPQIVLLMLRQFSVPVLVANLAGWPVAFWLTRDWLNGFAVRIGLSPLFFVGAGVVALVVAWATVFGHAYRVARASPVEALRYE